MKHERGSAIVEFSLAIPLMVSLFLGTFQFGYAYYVYNELEQAVRAGARYASLRSYDANYDTAVKNVVVYGDPAPSGSPTPVVKGLGLGNVEVTRDTTAGTVRVNIKNFSVGTFWGLTLPDKPSTQFPLVGS